MTKRYALDSTASTSRDDVEAQIHVVGRVAPRANAFSISSSTYVRGPKLVMTSPSRRLMGRKGREALAKRRALDGAFLTAAMGAVALIWWSTF